MLKSWRHLALLLGLWTAPLGGGASACEKFTAVDSVTANQLMRLVEDDGAKAIDRIYAFETLTCSSLPVLRRFALETGLKSKDPLLRSQALAETLFQRESIRVEFSDSSDLGPQERDWLKRWGGSYTYDTKYRNRTKNCVSSHYDNRADDCSGFVARIDGDKVRMSNQNVRYELQLQADNTLRGFVKPSDSLRPIPTKVSLF